MLLVGEALLQGLEVRLVDLLVVPLVSPLQSVEQVSRIHLPLHHSLHSNSTLEQQQLQQHY